MIPEGGFLALDWGGGKVGYATCDETGCVVTPRGHFKRKSKHRPWELIESDRLALRKLVEEFQPGALILGLPLNADGTESTGSRGARELATELHKVLKLEVVLVNELLTSWTAKGAPDEDAAAAASLIQDHLAALKGLQ